MPRTESASDFDAKSPPFDQFKGLQALGEDRRGHVSAETARHRLYVGTDKRTNTSALIKVTSRPGLTYQGNLANEIASLLTINQRLPESKYFPLVREHGELRDGRVYLISTFFPELPLATAIGTEPIPGKTGVYLRTAMEVARALGQLHGLQIYHVDLNPMNILVRSGHGRPVIRIIDFESSYESARHAAGVFYNPPNTPGYSAPEVPGQAPDARSDVFSLGAVLYTMLAGYTWMWEGEVGRCVSGDRDLDPELRRILLEAVDPDPASRYPSMKDLHADLAVHLERIWPGKAADMSWERAEGRD
jgi:serine/threonine protein kinase